MEKMYKKVGRKYTEIEAPRFNIDFFCFSFLVATCIPPRPIARSMFWKDVINKHYHTLTKLERSNLFEWINREYAMQDGIEKGNEDCLLFNARFDSENQYTVSTLYEGIELEHECFKWGGKYHTSESQSILEDYITKVEKI